VTEFVDHFIMECDMQSWYQSPTITLPANMQVAVCPIILSLNLSSLLKTFDFSFQYVDDHI
jgi:hypothetical protein